MKPYFEDPFNQGRLEIEARRWKGTPFLSGVGSHAKPGAGADCVSFVERVLVNVGAIEPIQWPKYATHGGGWDMFSLLLGSLESIQALRCVWVKGSNEPPKPMPGDVLVGTTGKTLHHLAICMAGGKLVHCLENGGVQEGSLGDAVVKRTLYAIYRPMML